MMNRIIILGYMGAGKTTIGKALSKATGMPFYDLDWYIENRMRKTIPQIFEERGEEGFRNAARSCRVRECYFQLWWWHSLLL